MRKLIALTLVGITLFVGGIAIGQSAVNDGATSKQWAIEQELFVGENGDYKWGEPVTRGQLARILYRQAGSPLVVTTTTTRPVVSTASPTTNTVVTTVLATTTTTRPPVSTTTVTPPSRELGYVFLDVGVGNSGLYFYSVKLNNRPGIAWYNPFYIVVTVEVEEQNGLRWVPEFHFSNANEVYQARFHMQSVGDYTCKVSSSLSQIRAGNYQNCLIERRDVGGRATTTTTTAPTTTWETPN